MRLGRITDGDREVSRSFGSATRRRRVAFRPSVFFSCGAMVPVTDTPFHRAGRHECRAPRPEPLRECNAPRCTSVRFRAPSTGESWSLRRASRPPRHRRFCRRRHRFRHAFHALRCALGTALSRPTTCRSPVSVNRTTPSTPRASATSARSHWPAAPRPSGEGWVLSAPALASRFIPLEGS